MKRNLPSFLSGFLTCTLVFSLAISALAISGRMTIEVDPINVQVNGEVFQPTDVTGKEVPVFAYQGTTYAPLRALAEAYGLEVGYDKAANMATVTDPDVKTPDTTTPDTTAKADYSDWSAEDEAAYQEFKAMWKIVPMKGKEYAPDDGHDGKMVEAYYAEYIGTSPEEDARASVKDALKNGFCDRLAAETQVHNDIIFIWFRGSAEYFDYFDSSL